MLLSLVVVLVVDMAVIKKVIIEYQARFERPC